MRRVYGLLSDPATNMNESAKQALVREKFMAFAQFQVNQALKALNSELAEDPSKMK